MLTAEEMQICDNAGSLFTKRPRVNIVVKTIPVNSVTRKLRTDADGKITIVDRNGERHKVDSIEAVTAPDRKSMHGIDITEAMKDHFKEEYGCDFGVNGY